MTEHIFAARFVFRLAFLIVSVAGECYLFALAPILSKSKAGCEFMHTVQWEKKHQVIVVLDWIDFFSWFFVCEIRLKWLVRRINDICHRLSVKRVLILLRKKLINAQSGKSVFNQQMITFIRFDLPLFPVTDHQLRFVVALLCLRALCSVQAAFYQVQRPIEDL